MNIVFFGTPELAAVILSALLDSEHHVAAVVSQPDRPKGRGNRLEATPVKATAQERDIAVIQPERVREKEFIKVLRDIPADIFVVAAFGQMLPRDILTMPRYGCINVHTSLLPKYRGASPVTQAIVNGERETGVTIMQMDKGMDTGPILHAKRINIDPSDTAGSLMDKLAVLGGSALLEALDLINKGLAKPQPQDHAAATYTTLLTKEMGRLNFNKPAKALTNQVRGMDPWPGAFAATEDGILKVWKACQGKPANGATGHVVSTADAITVACGGGETVDITEVQGPGGKRLSAREYLKGHKIPAGYRFM